MSKVQYIGIPTRTDIRTYEELLECNRFRETFNPDLYGNKQTIEDVCPECSPKMRNVTIYTAFSHPAPLIFDFYEHPDGVMAEIAGSNTLVRLKLPEFLDKFKRFIDIIEDDTTFEDHIREVMTGSQLENLQVEKILPEIIHSNWDNLTRKEKQVAGIVALNAIRIIDKIKADEKDQIDLLPKPERKNRGDIKLQDKKSPDVHSRKEVL